MARNKTAPVYQEALEPVLQAGQPDIEELDPEMIDTADDPPLSEITEAAIERRTGRPVNVSGAPAINSRRVPEAQSVEQPSAFADIEPTIESEEPMVAVRPRRTFDCVIGNRRWYFEKDKLVSVPQTVRDMLAIANYIHP